MVGSPEAGAVSQRVRTSRSPGPFLPKQARVSEQWKIEFGLQQNCELESYAGETDD